MQRLNCYGLEKMSGKHDDFMQYDILQRIQEAKRTLVGKLLNFKEGL